MEAFFGNPPSESRVGQNISSASALGLAWSLNGVAMAFQSFPFWDAVDFLFRAIPFQEWISIGGKPLEID